MSDAWCPCVSTSPYPRETDTATRRNALLGAHIEGCDPSPIFFFLFLIPFPSEALLPHQSLCHTIPAMFFACYCALRSNVKVRPCELLCAMYVCECHMGRYDYAMWPHRWLWHLWIATPGSMADLADFYINCFAHLIFWMRFIQNNLEVF